MPYTSKKSSLYQVQQTILTKLIKTFCLKTVLYVKNFKKTHKSVLKKLCDIKNDYILDWYKEELQTLRVFFSKESDQKNMHESRKTLKKLLFVYAILRKPIQDKLKLNKHYLRELEKTIGMWHDVTVSIEILSNSNFACNKTVKKLSEQKQKLLKLCRKLSKNFPEKSVA